MLSIFICFIKLTNKEVVIAGTKGKKCEKKHKKVLTLCNK